MPSARTAPHSFRPAVLAVLAVLATALVVGLVSQSPTPSSSSSPGPSDSPSAGSAAPSSAPPETVEAPRDDGRGARETANLDPALREAMRRAEADAARDGVAFVVNSGWRSAEHQERLLREAVARYGSTEEAARWVATPDTSPHVSGDAVDVGNEAAAWLSARGAAYGLCQIYVNEPWHYELRPEAIDERCPPMYADPTHDPRMQR